MIRSMTGFGRSDVATDLCTITVEARSVNHRHLDLAIRLPRALVSLEPRVLRTEVTVHVEAMMSRAAAGAARREERLRERITSLIQGAGVDEARVLTEVAMWAEKSDIAEELARLRAHLDQLALTLDKGG